ncbi:hypothetical protein HMI54_013765 [Coelomomyces lativittatus]|nr:hypothetical protein HMI54_013765 [Coelomomyces lativittatus]
MSGGVDSCMAAYLLKRKGYQVTGIYMKNWDVLEEEPTSTCQSDQAWIQVQQICHELKLPCLQLNFVKEYWNHVFAKALQSYERGETPNPDVFCNKHIKFGTFIEKTLGQQAYDWIATGMDLDHP